MDRRTDERTDGRTWTNLYPSAFGGVNKDKLLLKYWRSISLLNTSYKLASSCIEERLITVLPKIINEDQIGFIKGRKPMNIIRYNILYGKTANSWYASFDRF